MLLKELKILIEEKRNRKEVEAFSESLGGASLDDNDIDFV